jgi:hypothetical protein
MQAGDTCNTAANSSEEMMLNFGIHVDVEAPRPVSAILLPSPNHRRASCSDPFRTPSLANQVSTPWPTPDSDDILNAGQLNAPADALYPLYAIMP